MQAYKTPLTALLPNQIFVFDSNTQGRHGKGAALWALENAGAVNGKPRGLQGRSYAIVTKNLKCKIHPSVLKKDIVAAIAKFYLFACKKPSKQFIVAYTSKPGLSGYSPKEMAEMFKACFPVPSNVVFEKTFLPLIKKAKAHCSPLSIVMDTREQKPLWKISEVQRHKLDYGDYTTERLHNIYHIERKSLQDLYGTIIQGHERFRNELVGAQVNGVKLSLYVEGTKKDFIAKKFPGGERRKFPSGGLAKMIHTIEHKYGIDVVWCKSRNASKKAMLGRFKLEEKKLK